ncbi:MAG: hypothetical protein E2P02_17205 [Acidobacteria bacterium]|nr:MAG: hypothetical protein E2P02_17205 [Acidobacteriota bacterium]
MRVVFSGILVLALAGLHVAYPWLEERAARRRHIWVPVSAGIAIGYVFLYMLPKLSDYTRAIIAAEPSGAEFFHYRVFLFALFGFLFYFIVDRDRLPGHPRAELATSLHSASFCFYNALVGYIIPHIPRPGLVPLFVASAVLGVHLLGINHQLRHWHPNRFDRTIRWLLAASIVFGWALATFTSLPKELLLVMTGFLAGAIVVNVMMEELPEKDDPRRVVPFLVGIGIFLVVMIFIRSLPHTVG